MIPETGITCVQPKLPGMTGGQLDGTRRHGMPRRQTHRWDRLPQFPYCTDGMVGNLGPAPVDGFPGQTDLFWATGGPVGRHTACRVAVDATGTAWPLGCGVPLSQGRFEASSHSCWDEQTVDLYCGTTAAEHYVRTVVGTLIGLAVARVWSVYACPERETVTVHARDLKLGRMTQVGVLVEGSIFGPAGDIRFERGDWPAVDRDHPWTRQPISRKPLR